MENNTAGLKGITQQLGSARKAVANSFAKVAEGIRDRSAGNASSSSALQAIQNAIDSNEIAKKNLVEVVSYLQFSENMLNVLRNSLAQMKEMTAKVSISDGERGSENEKFQQIGASFLKKIQETTYNNVQVFKTRNVQANLGSGETERLTSGIKAQYKDRFVEVEGSLADIIEKVTETRNRLSIDGRVFLDTLSDENAKEAGERIDSMDAAVASMLDSVSQAMNAMQGASDQIDAANRGMSKFKEKLGSLDSFEPALAFAKNFAARPGQDTGMKVLSQANQSAGRVLSLLTANETNSMTVSDNGPTIVSLTQDAIEKLNPKAITPVESNTTRKGLSTLSTAVSKVPIATNPLEVALGAELNEIPTEVSVAVSVEEALNSEPEDEYGGSSFLVKFKGV